jgi:predicted nucleic acid-binding protein
MHLLDTNIIINFLEASLPPVGMQLLNKIVDEQCNISIISKMEALGFNFKTAAEKYMMEFFINGSNIFHLNDDIVNQTIAIRKSKKIALPDAIIAATALTNDLILISRNVSDFNGIKGLKYINPWNA